MLKRLNKLQGLSFCVLAVQIASSAQVLSADQNLFANRTADSVLQIQRKGELEYNYFDAGHNAHIKHQLDLVNQFHINKKLSQNVGAGKYEAAMIDIDYALRHFPNHPAALQLLTTVAAMSKNRGLPLPYFEKAIAMYPGHGVTHAQYGWYLATIGNLEAGIEKMNYAIQLDPNLRAGYVWLAKAYEKKGDMKSAREIAERAKQMGFDGNPSPVDPRK